MALARCETCGRPSGLKQTYSHVHAMVSSERLLCGAPSCTRLALVWLTEEEQHRYAGGLRVFRVSQRAVEVILA
jgi:hypothetical protein